VILNIYLFLVFFSLIIIFLGFKIDNPSLEIAGFFFLLFLGTIMFSGLVQYSMGDTIQYDSTNTTILSINQNYTYFDASSSEIILGFPLYHIFGILISVVSGFGMAITLTNLGGKEE